MRNLYLSIIAVCLLGACATQAPKCPLGGVTYISASGDNAKKLAYDMAARDTLKDGFDKFTVLSTQENPQQVKMTVHMLHAHENDPSFVAIDAHRYMPSPASAVTSTL